jgi:predicted nucleotidyltransferase
MLVPRTYVNAPCSPDQLQLWMAAWTDRQESNTSNYKDLYTLLHTLKHEQAKGNLFGRYIIYFTDDATT